jgi:hypothetical protein
MSLFLEQAAEGEEKYGVLRTTYTVLHIHQLHPSQHFACSKDPPTYTTTLQMTPYILLASMSFFFTCHHYLPFSTWCFLKPPTTCCCKGPAELQVGFHSGRHDAGNKGRRSADGVMEERLPGKQGISFTHSRFFLPQVNSDQLSSLSISTERLETGGECDGGGVLLSTSRLLIVTTAKFLHRWLLLLGFFKDGWPRISSSCSWSTAPV